MDDPKTTTVPLKRPVEAHGEKRSSLTLRELDFEAFRRAVDGAKGEAERVGRLIARSAQVPPSTIDRVCLADYIALQDAFAELHPELEAQADLAGKATAAEEVT